MKSEQGISYLGTDDGRQAIILSEEVAKCTFGALSIFRFGRRRKSEPQDNEAATVSTIYIRPSPQSLDVSLDIEERAGSALSDIVQCGEAELARRSDAARLENL